MTSTAPPTSLDRYREELTALQERRSARVIRRVLEKLSAYRGAEAGRLTSDWTTTAGSADSDLQADLGELRNRSRDLVRNDGLAAGAIQAFVDNVVGRGIVPQSQVNADALGITEEQAEEFQDAAEGVWRRWCRTADSSDRVDFNGLQSLALSSTLTNGDCFTIPLMVSEPHRPYMLAVDVIEADRVETPTGRWNDDTLRFGVELGDRGQPVAYHVKKTHPGDSWSGRPDDFVRYTTRNPRTGRRNVLHHFRPLRPGQTRGVPILAPVLREFHDRRAYLESERIAARAAACIAMVITSLDPEAARNTNLFKDGLTEELEPGVMQYLAPGEDMKAFDPSRPNSGLAAYLETQDRTIAIGTGLSYGTLTRNYSRSNFSNTRAEIMADRRVFRCMQQWWAWSFCHPYWEMLLEEAWLRGELPHTDLDFMERIHLWGRADWIPDGWDWLDPLKDIQAAREGIEIGVESRTRVIKQRGGDPLEVFRDLEREKEFVDAITPASEQPAMQPAGVSDDDGNDDADSAG